MPWLATEGHENKQPAEGKRFLRSQLEEAERKPHKVNPKFGTEELDKTPQEMYLRLWEFKGIQAASSWLVYPLVSICFKMPGVGGAPAPAGRCIGVHDRALGLQAVPSCHCFSRKESLCGLISHHSN